MVGEAGEPAEVEGTSGGWRVDPAAIGTSFAVDASTDRTRSVLRVHAIHQDVRFTRAITAAVHAELEALASWLGLTAVSTD
jgi:uncharacterized protein YcaQ